MTTKMWTWVSSELENECVTAAEDGDDETSYYANDVMDRGDSCVRRFDRSWPGDDVVSPVTFSREQWLFTQAVLRRWAEVADRIGHQDKAAESRRIADLVSEALDA